MKYAVVTRADEHIKPMTDVTFPIIKEYVNKIGADFHVFDHESEYMTHDNRPHYRIFKMYDLYEEYDRMLHIDADVLIRPDCPNIFDVVDPECIGTIFEDVGYRTQDRRKKIRDIQREWGDVGWRTGYQNGGVYVTSKMHREIFTPFEDKAWFPDGSADLHLSFQAYRLGFKFQELSYKWNHMIVWPQYNRFDSYIIHYAGSGWREGNNSRIEQIKQDYNKWYNKNG